MSKPNKKIILRRDAPCPCGSGKTITACHLDPIDGRFRKRLAPLRPPGQATGFSHPGCYLRDTCDCLEKLSREHYISQSVLEQLGTSIRVSGMPWLRSGETFDAGIGSLTAKILCGRHNAALSPLDAEAGLFFSILSKALIDLERKTFSRKPTFHLVSGDAVELWMLKVACGLYFAVGAKDGAKLAENHTIDMRKVRRAFFERQWDARAGLYFRGAAGSMITVAPGVVGISPLVMEKDLRFGGATVSMLGFTLELLFDTKGSNAGAWDGIVGRPGELTLKRGDRQHSIILTWPPGTPATSIVMAQGPKSQ